LQRANQSKRILCAGFERQSKGVNLPNSLTLSRIFVVPLLVVVLLTPFSEEWLGVQRHIVGVAIFLAAAFTDFLDGQSHAAAIKSQGSASFSIQSPTSC
jgi:hypothetical protein